MPKKKTSRKHGVSFEDMPTLKVKKGSKTSKFDATKRMRDKKYVSQALWACMLDNDVEGFKEILRSYLELVNKDEFARKAGLSRRTLFRMLSKEGNPTLDKVSKIVHQLCA